MQTVKLYDEDPRLLRVECQVLSCEKIKESFAVVTDRTLFFARGGGQECDRGTLAGQPVLDTYEDGGRLLHVLAQPVEPGAAEMEIEWATRLDHMQQHSGQHVLSAAVQELFGVPSIIARLEHPICHVEFPTPLTPAQLLAAQDRANEIIAQDRAIRCFFVTPEESKTMPVRGKITPHEHVRLVEIDGFDLNACGGTHCASTGEIARVTVCGTKEVRGNFRVYYVCGGRALDMERQRTPALVAMQQALGLEQLEQLCTEIPALLARKNQLEEQVRALREQLIESDAERFLALSEDVPGGRLFCRAVDGGDAKHLKAVCDRLTVEHPITLLLAAVGEQQTGLIFTRHKGDGIDLGKALRAVASSCGGKGGGSAVLAQGVVPSDSAWRSALDGLAAELRG